MKSNQSNIKKVKKYLDKNHCVAVPTETVYGLAGNAYSDLSVKKIFKLNVYFRLKILRLDILLGNDIHNCCLIYPMKLI